MDATIKQTNKNKLKIKQFNKATNKKKLQSRQASNYQSCPRTKSAQNIVPCAAQ